MWRCHVVACAFLAASSFLVVVQPVCVVVVAGCILLCE
jgi:hypothetical protein